MKKIIYILVSTVIIACNNNQPIIREGSSKVDSLIVNSNQGKKEKVVRGIIYESENIIITGDTTIDKEKIFYASIKFEPYISFDDFKVSNIDNRNKAKLSLSSNKGAKQFRTRLRAEYQDNAPNFAGHYTFAKWGCGSPCQMSLLIDRQTGKIYDSPGASLGYEYHVDSRMLLTNLPNENGYYDDCIYCKPIIYVFSEKSKKFKELKPKN